MTVQVQRKVVEIPANISRRRVTVGECRRKVAFMGLYAAMLILAVIFAPHAYMKFAFAASALVRLLALRREYDLLRRVQNGEIIEIVRPAQLDNPSRIASIVAVILVTTFALACTALTIATLLALGNSHNAAVFFLVVNLIVWGFAACIWRAAYRSARLPAASQRTALSTLPVSGMTIVEATSAPQEAVASVPVSASPRHWWTDTQTREENKVTAGQR